MDSGKGKGKHTDSSPPVFETARLRLRPWRDTDAPSTDPDTLGRQFMSGAMPTRAEFPVWLLTRESRMAEGEGYYWCVADHDTDEPLGHVQCFRLNSPMTLGSGWLGYWLYEHARGRGVISDALNLLVGQAFSPVEAGGLGLHRLAALTDLNNAASQRVLRRTGFTECGHEREAMAHDGLPAADAISFELLASDDRATRRAVPALPPVFGTSRLRLRPWRDTDAPGDGEGPDADSLRFMPAGAQPGPDDFPKWLAKRRREMDTGVDLHWCLADLTTDEMLGNVQIFRMGPVENRFQGELGYWLRPGARGRGVIGEALGPVIAHAFASADEGGLGLIRLHAATDSDNHASQSILRSAGFTQWGADHQAWRRGDGSLSDGTYFELLASERHAAALEPITLGGHRIRLREWRHTDAERVAAGCSDERTQHWLAGSLPSEYTLEHAHSYMDRCGEQARNGHGVYWCVADAESDLCLGAISVMDLRDALGTAAEIGYWTHPDARGRGVMSEAVRLAVRHAFIASEDGGLGRKRLRLNVADGNTASQHIARANGFVEVGRDRQAEPLGDGTFADLVRFDLLVDEWDRPLPAPIPFR